MGDSPGRFVLALPPAYGSTGPSESRVPPLMPSIRFWPGRFLSFSLLSALAVVRAADQPAKPAAAAKPAVSTSAAANAPAPAPVIPGVRQLGDAPPEPTPPPIPDGTVIQYLSGRGKDDTVLWDFMCTGGRHSGEWTKIKVPSCWEQEGFGTYDYGVMKRPPKNPQKPRPPPLADEQGKYRFVFDVPGNWHGRPVRIVFDGVMTDAEVTINQRSAGPVHQGAFYRFSYDITSLVRFGDTNTLEVTVSKVSANASVNRAERYADYWNFGGIFRPVWIECRPAEFIERTAIDARADGNFSADVFLGPSLATADQVRAQVLDATDAPVGDPFTVPVTAGAEKVTVRGVIPGPKLWTAETPDLYHVRFTLLAKGQSLHSVLQRFGFRTFEVRAGDGLYLNGKKIILKGANRHCFWPESGRTLSKQISYDDVKLIKDGNMNAVRMSHYPPDEHFLEACDELGLYVLDELGGWQQSYDTPTGARLIGELIRRDVNHPSILFWDNGNEGGWNRENDGEFAKWDPQNRAVLHPWELHGGVNTKHYPDYALLKELCAGPDVFMPTEFAHGLYDGGIGAGLKDFWDVMRASPRCAGGFIWSLVDESVVRTDLENKIDSNGNYAPDGMVGPHREREASYFTVKALWSPVQIPQEQLPGNFSGVLPVENNYDFTNLSNCRVEWELGVFPSFTQVAGNGHATFASGAMAAPEVAPHSIGELHLPLPANWRLADVLNVGIRDSTGRLLWTWSWTWPKLTQPKRTPMAEDDAITIRNDNAEQITVRAGAYDFRFSTKNAELISVSKGDKTISFGHGPRLMAAKYEERKLKEFAPAARLVRFNPRIDDDGNALIEARFVDGGLRTLRWRVFANGSVRLDYEYEVEGALDFVGMNFDYPEEKMKSRTWLGDGPFRVWRNRTVGARFDVWRTAFNDPVPGESWTYPEFKGYFANWRWALYATTEGYIAIEREAGATYLGSYAPRDGVNGILAVPASGLSFLDEIPSMTSKNHTQERLGPQSATKTFSGVQHGTLNFYFSPK